MFSNATENAETLDRLVRTAVLPGNAGKQFVGVYIRYDNSRLKTSLQYQKEHYLAFFRKHPDWLLAGIYADEGMTEENVDQNRTALKQLFLECQQGRITMVITWTVTNLSFHILECLILIDKFSNLSPSVGIYFELQNYFSLNDRNHLPVHNHFLYLNLKATYEAHEQAFEEERKNYLRIRDTDHNEERRFN